MADKMTVTSQDLIRCLGDMMETAQAVQARLEAAGRDDDASKARDMAQALDVVRSILEAHFDEVEGGDLYVPPIPGPRPPMPYLQYLCTTASS